MPGNEVVVVGAGITGATLALGLADIAGCPVKVVDNQEPVGFPQQPVSRVSALGLAAERILCRVGVWQDLPAERLSPYRRMDIWDAGSSGRLEFDAADVGEAHLGHIIENDLLVWHLQARLSEHENIVVRYGQAPETVSCARGKVRLLLSGDELEGGLLVGADGGRSWVRDQVNIGSRVLDYGQTGIVCRIRTEAPHEQTAWQRFLPTGPVAVLPMADGHSSIVWSADQDRANALLSMGDNEFATELESALQGRLGKILEADKRLGFPLGSARADSYISDRVALVGDAAHRVHPLAGQGANLGLKDVAALVEVVRDAAEIGRDIGSRLVLRRYERWRKTENTTIDALMSSLKRIFAGESSVPGPLRGAGMNTLNSLGGIKNLMARHAMGTAGDLPGIIKPGSGSAE